MPLPRTATAALGAGLVLFGAGCAVIAPGDEPAATETRSDSMQAAIILDDPPTTLALVADDASERSVDTLTVNTPASLTVSKTTDVHSGPSMAFTVLTTFAAGDTVAATGVRVDSDGTVWLEVETDSTYNGWVDAADVEDQS